MMRYIKSRPVAIRTKEEALEFERDWWFGHAQDIWRRAEAAYIAGEYEELLGYKKQYEHCQERHRALCAKLGHLYDAQDKYSK